jgi:hypothetical protein
MLKVEQYQRVAKLPIYLLQYVYSLEDSGLVILNPLTIPMDLKLTDDDWKAWKHDLLNVAFINQGMRCPSCGKALGTQHELHHGLLTKANARGTSDEMRPRILECSYNVALLHKPCHAKETRQHFWGYQAKLYGEANMTSWYERVPLKKLPFKVEFLQGEHDDRPS